ncbi:MAG: GNAT family N-acetyltransferase [Spirochaetaceae bacterium]
MQSPCDDVTIQANPQLGDIGALVSLHGALFCEAYGLDASFEADVAATLGTFATNRGSREVLWIVKRGQEVMGSLGVARHNDREAEIRWFVLDPELRCQGLGSRLLEDALDFCRRQNYRSVHVWTAVRFKEAEQLYRHHGFRLTEQYVNRKWGSSITEQRYDLIFRQEEPESSRSTTSSP